jgi:hypothetical protein
MARPGGLGRKPHPDTPVAASHYPVSELADYKLALNTNRYWWEGGAFLDQGQTGTCVGNAFAHRRADSPQPTAGIDETYARQLYLDASGDTTLQEGTSGILACRVLANRGTITQYHWITSATEMRNTVLTLGAVCVGTNWFNSMFWPKVNYSNYYLKVDPTSGLAGGHEYVINGINLVPASGPPFYRMKNSWGTSWGKNGTARINCTDLEDLLFNRDGDAVLITEVPDY